MKVSVDGLLPQQYERSFYDRKATGAIVMNATDRSIEVTFDIFDPVISLVIHQRGNGT